MYIKRFWTIAFLLMPAAAWATDAPLVGDTYVSTANSSLNFGNLPSLTVGGGNVALLQFDLSTLPAGITSASVLKATLEVFVDRVGTSGNIQAATLLGPWLEGTVTNVTFPGSGGLVGQTNAVSTAGEFLSIDITTQVQAWLTTPGSNYGLALTSTGELYLDSKEATTTSHPAKLDVTIAGLPTGAEFVSTPGGGSNTAAGYATLTDPTGFYNTAFGASTLSSSTSSVYNTAIGDGALQHATNGSVNTAVGSNALTVNTTGSWNNAFGGFALGGNTTGEYNTAVGFYTLDSNTTGSLNTAVGAYALYTYLNTPGTGIAGSTNLALGSFAGQNLVAGSNNIYLANFGAANDSGVIRIGDSHQSRTFIAGIRGVGTGVSNAVEVVIDSNGQLGTINSSRRFKNEITDMGDASDGLLKLRPVTFHYKQPTTDGVERLEYGLIAEEVADVYPEAVTYTPSGEAETIQYHKINAMLLNEVQKEHRQIEDQSREMEALRERMAALEKALESAPRQNR